MKEFQPYDQPQFNPETGEGSGGLSKPQPELAKPQQERGERKPLPSVWEVLGREVRLYNNSRLIEPGYKDRVYEESQREFDEVNRLSSELREKGTARDKLIFNLYDAITYEPTSRVDGCYRCLSPEEFYELRSWLEPLDNEHIHEVLRKRAKEITRKRDDFSPR
jgi:hypothetical protein